MPTKPIKILQKLKLKYNYKQNLQLYAVGFRSLICFSKCSIMPRFLNLLWATFNISLPSKQSTCVPYQEVLVSGKGLYIKYAGGGQRVFAGAMKYFSQTLMGHKKFLKFLDGPQNVFFLFFFFFLILTFSKFIWKSNWFWVKIVQTIHQEPLT